MEVVFDTRTMAAGKRRQAWRDAMCEIYLQVDCQTDPDFEYAGLSERPDWARSPSRTRSFRPKQSAGETTTSAASERIVTTWG